LEDLKQGSNEPRPSANFPVIVQTIPDYPFVDFIVDHHGVLTIANHGRFPILDVKVKSTDYFFNAAGEIEGRTTIAGYDLEIPIIAAGESNTTDLLRLKSKEPMHFCALRFSFTNSPTGKPYVFYKVMDDNADSNTSVT
jgi:hypothetical protein